MKYYCNECDWVYDEEETGYDWEELPDDFTCEKCGAGKEAFSAGKKLTQGNLFTPYVLKYTALVVGLLAVSWALHHIAGLDLQSDRLRILLRIAAGAVTMPLAASLVNFFRYRHFKKENGNKPLSPEQFAEKMDERLKKQCRAQYEWEKRNGR